MQEPDQITTTNIASRVRLGADYETAAMACGVDRRTALGWLAQGSEACQTLQRMVVQAEEGLRASLEAVIQREGFNGCAGAMARVTEHRDSRGRFVKGNPGGPGQPRRAVEDDFLAVLSEECPPEEWRAICRRAVEQAKGGCHKARAWVAGYMVGPPAPNRLHQLAAQECAETDPVQGTAHRLRFEEMRNEVIYAMPAVPLPPGLPTTLPPFPTRRGQA